MRLDGGLKAKGIYLALIVLFIALAISVYFFFKTPIQTSYTISSPVQDIIFLKTTSIIEGKVNAVNNLDISSIFGNIDYSGFILEDILPSGASLCSNLTISMKVNGNDVGTNFYEGFVKYAGGTNQNISIFIMIDREDLENFGAINNISFAVSYDICNLNSQNLGQTKLFYVRAGEVYTIFSNTNQQSQPLEITEIKEKKVIPDVKEDYNLPEFMLAGEEKIVLSIKNKKAEGYIWDVEINNEKYIGAGKRLLINASHVCPDNYNKRIRVTSAVTQSLVKNIDCKKVMATISKGKSYSLKLSPKLIGRRLYKIKCEILGEDNKKLDDSYNPSCGIAYPNIESNEIPYIAVVKSGNYVYLPEGSYNVVFQADNYDKIEERFSVIKGRVYAGERGDEQKDSFEMRIRRLG